MRNILYSEREDEIIRAMAAKGASLQDMMEVLSRTDNSLSCHLKRMGIVLDKPGREIDEEKFKQFMKGR